MRSLSNIIRAKHGSLVEPKVILTKKIDIDRLGSTGRTGDPQQRKQQLMQDIEALEVRYRQMQQQITEERDNAQAAINQWWEEKQKEAEQNAERLAGEASANGFQAGFEQGMLQAKTKFQEKRREMQSVIETAYAEKAKMIQESEMALLSLSVKVAERVIQAELKQNREQLVNIVRQALKQIEESEDVVIQVSSEDYPLILPFLEELQTYVKADSALKLIPVANLDQGGCLIHTANGSYDVTIDSQLQEMKRQLLAYCEETMDDGVQNR